MNTVPAACSELVSGTRGPQAGPCAGRMPGSKQITSPQAGPCAGRMPGSKQTTSPQAGPRAGRMPGSKQTTSPQAGPTRQADARLQANQPIQAKTHTV